MLTPFISEHVLWFSIITKKIAFVYPVAKLYAIEIHAEGAAHLQLGPGAYCGFDVGLDSLDNPSDKVPSVVGAWAW